MARRTLGMVGVALCAATTARGADPPIDLALPAERTFVVDYAELIDAPEQQQLEALSAALFEAHQTMLLVITIESMADHWPHGDIRIETFAHLLFDQWEVGDAELNGETWNTGMMLLVSEGDRRARIQLGAGWGRDKDAVCQRIMDRQIVPQFKRRRFGAGIVDGAKALDAMARGKPMPATRAQAARAPRGPGRSGRGVSPRRSGGSGMMLVLPLFCGCAGLIVLAILFAPRRGSRRRRGRGRGGSGGGFGGFGGGSFGGGGGGFSGGGGGGFSGGGGASGGW
ncbi:MAG: hypothetical protein GY715_14505 [Planctomycetes bacterium]|nr:hypothetical protein [Planctomycetota bacterium]